MINLIQLRIYVIANHNQNKIVLNKPYGGEAISPVTAWNREIATLPRLVRICNADV